LKTDRLAGVVTTEGDPISEMRRGALTDSGC